MRLYHGPSYVIPFGIDTSHDVSLDECTCGAEGHRLLARCWSSGPVSNNDLSCSAAGRARLRNQGLILLTEAAEGGWPRGWWTAELTPAGLLHAATLAGQTVIHAGASGCGGTWTAERRCAQCQKPQLLTIALARQYLQSLPPGDERDRAIKNSALSCVRHGRCRPEMVRTDKRCAWCEDGLIRGTSVSLPPEEDNASLS